MFLDFQARSQEHLLPPPLDNLPYPFPMIICRGSLATSFANARSPITCRAQQVAKELVANGVTVLVGSRNFERGEAADSEYGAGAIAPQLDVTDRVSIADAAERVRKEFGRLDLLVQNAAISNTRKGTLPLPEYAQISRASNASLDEVRTVWETNVFGVLAVYQAMLPLLRESSDARIINVSSAVGSLTSNADPAYPYHPNVRPGLPCVQGSSERDHAGHDGRTGVNRDQG